MTSTMHQCEKCDKSFSRKSVLISHTKFHLEKKKTLCCDKCQKTFVQQCDLPKHSLIQIKEEKFH